MLDIGMILDNSFPPDPRVVNEAQVLIRAGHRVHLFCLDYTGGTQPQEEDYQGLHVIRHPVSPRMRSISALAYTLPFYHNLLAPPIEAFIHKHKIQILHVHDMQVVPAVQKANRKTSLPLFIDLHENRPEIMKFYTHVNTLQGKLLIYPSTWKKAEFRQIKEADAILVVTPEARDYYCEQIEVAKEKFVMLPNTVHADFYEDAQPLEDIEAMTQGKFNLLYLGETGFRRGIMTVLQSLPMLVDTIPNIQFVIVGKSVADATYKAFVKEKGLEVHVRFEGWQDVARFPSYILASQICVSPIHRNIHHDTTYANKIFQYLSLGKPILVSDATAQANIALDHNCGLVHRAEDAKEFADKVLQLYKDPAQQMEMGQKGQDFVRNSFTWLHTSQGLVQLYADWEEKINS
ncbi:MAG: glycosyltransferase family 4 protein [Bacteroidota bacterium]